MSIRPKRENYPPNRVGDLWFSQALVTWQYEEIERLKQENEMLRGWLEAERNRDPKAAYA